MTVPDSPLPIPATPTERAALAARIDRVLPQTQCTKCGYQGCAPYAQAIADGSALYNRCPPGGREGIERLAHLLGRPPLELDPTCGVERPRPVAFIDESLCIGCTLCIQACPVDAIVGAPKVMHTVVASLCTGCDLCVAPCPVDCIAMLPASGAATGWAAWSQAQADAARTRYTQRNARLEAARADAAARVSERAAAAAQPASEPEADAEQARKKAIIAAAIERARKQRENTPNR